MNPNTAIPLNKLVAWEGNVRKTESDKGIDELAASIKAHGLLQSLVVQKDKGDKFAVVAGRRRLKALQRLVKEKHIPADHPVNCQPIEAEANATEISLVENVQREQMHPADEFDAFKALIDAGIPPADIAARFGVTEAVVQKRLKLANVSPKLIALYRKGEMTLQHVMAFTVTDDHKAQERVWEDAQQYHEVDADTIRDTLTEDEIRGDDRRFSSSRLKATKEPVALSGAICSAMAMKVFSSWTGFCLRLLPESCKRSRRTKNRKAGSGSNGESISTIPNGANASAFILITTTQTMKTRRKFGSPSIGRCRAIVSVGRDGEAEIHHGFIKPEDMPAEKGKKKDAAKGKSADKGNGISASLIEDLSIQRTAALGTALASNSMLPLPPRFTRSRSICTRSITIRPAFKSSSIGHISGVMTNHRQTRRSTPSARNGRRNSRKRAEALWDSVVRAGRQNPAFPAGVLCAHSVNAVMANRTPPQHTLRLCREIGRGRDWTWPIISRPRPKTISAR